MHWTCPVCNKSFKRSRQPHKCFSGGSPELGFAGAKAKWLPLYSELLAAVRNMVPFDCDYPPSGGAQWRRWSIFASMHGEKAGLYVNFFSSRNGTALQTVAITPVSANRLLHTVCLQDQAQIGELAEAIAASYYLTGQDGR